MKTIGLLGGMSWESTETYYRVINEKVRDAKGQLFSAPLLMHSLNFQEVVDCQKKADWKKATELLGVAAQNMEKSGADAIIICTNTMHIIAEQIQEYIEIPLLHIADAVAEKMKSLGLNKAGLLGTRFTMEQPFYKDYLRKHSIDTCVPDEAERNIVHSVIFDELCCGVIKDDSARA